MSVQVAQITNQLATDIFNRPDAATLGDAPSLQAWTYNVGSWGVAGKQAVVKTGGSGATIAALVNSLLGNVVARVRFVWQNDICHLIFRWGGSLQDYWSLNIGNGFVWMLDKTVGGVTTQKGTGALNLVIGQSYTLEVVAVGSTIRAAINGAVVAAVVDPDLAANVVHGFAASNSNQQPTSTVTLFQILGR